MNWKEFLKIDLRKIMIFVIVGILLSLFPQFLEILFLMNAMWTSYSSSFGFPLPFHVTIVSAPPLMISESTHFYSINLIIDIIVWYLISCIIIWFHDKRKKK